MPTVETKLMAPGSMQEEGLAGSENKPKTGRRAWWFRQRGLFGAALFVPAVALVALSKPLVLHDSPIDHIFEAAGFGFFLLYVFLRVWATMYVGDRKEKELVTDGPYSVCRNPLYLGSFCSALAIVLFLHSLTLVAFLAVAALLYRRSVIPSEEALLRSRFGLDFDRYCRETPRFLPKFSLYRSSPVVPVKLAGMRREMKRLLLSAALLLSAFALCHLRELPWWPHPFLLP